MADDDARAAIVLLLAARGGAKTICPSEVARVVGGADWRGAMPVVHAAVDALVADGKIGLSWKGVALAKRDGPYRIGGAISGRAGDRSGPTDCRRGRRTRRRGRMGA